MSYSIITALILAIWAYIGIVLQLGPGLWWTEPLIAGFVTGAVVGNIPLGLSIGGSLTLLSLGLWTYGGATIPDFQTGAIVGTAIGAIGGGSGAFAAGFAVALPTALLMTQMDVLGRAVTTIFIHGADHYAEEDNQRGLSAMHLLGQLPWGLTRAIPVFLAVWLGAGPIKSLIDAAPLWFSNGMTTAGHVLPALGFALLLSMLPLRRSWPYLLVGFVLFAYLKMPLIGVAILAVAVGFIMDTLQASMKPASAQLEHEAVQVADGTPEGGQNGSGDIVTLDRSVVRKAMWRHLITLQWSWNYERMQALGYAYSMLPVINAVYKEKAERIAAMKRHLVFYNTNPQVGSPPIFGAAVALEAQKQGETVDSIKVGLMGPLAGIGDTIQAILFRPIVAVFAASLALSGSYFGPLIMFLSGILWTVLMIPLFYSGYRQGIGVAQEVSSEGRVSRFTDMITTMGMIVIGAFIPSIMAAVTTPLKYSQTVSTLGQAHTETVALQTTLDSLLPYLLPILCVALAYWLLRGLKLSAVWVLIILFVLAFALGAVGIL